MPICATTWSRPISRQTNSITAGRKTRRTSRSNLNKFYVNALYVAMTRAMEGLKRLSESDVRHPLLGLLGLEEVAEIATAPVQPSTKDEWAQEGAEASSCRANRSKRRSIRRETFLAEPAPRRGPRGL